MVLDTQTTCWLGLTVPPANHTPTRHSGHELLEVSGCPCFRLCGSLSPVPHSALLVQKQPRQPVSAYRRLPTSLHLQTQAAEGVWPPVAVCQPHPPGGRRGGLLSPLVSPTRSV